MFLSKEKRKEDDIEVVRCEDCMALVAVTDAQKITNDMGWNTCFGMYYCKAHHKPYNRIKCGQYFREVEVDGEGAPVGYIKKPKETIPKSQNTNGSK